MAIRAKFGYYPANFDLEGFCQEYKLRANKVVEFLSIFIRNTRKKEFKDRVFLNAEILKNSIGKDYHKLIQALIYDGVILHTGSYVAKVKSNEFKLAPAFNDCLELIEYELIDNTLPHLKKINDERIKKRYAQELKIPKLKRKTQIPYEVFSTNFRHVTDWILNDKLEFNQEKALQILEDKGFKYSKLKKERNKYKYHLVSILGFKKDNIYANADYNYRFYSNLTSLPKIYRCCLTFDGEELRGYDVSNTHPILLANLCDSFFIKRLVKENAIEVDKELLAQFLKHLDTNPSDFLEYKNLVLSGQLYEKFNYYLPALTRPKIKKKFLAILNDENKDYNSEIKLIRQTLYDLFPTIALLLDLLKSIDYKYTSSILMTMEAQNFVIRFPEEMYYRLETEWIEPIPLFTIHDCFITTKSKLPILKKQLEWYFDKYFKMDVPIKPYPPDILTN